MMRILVCDHHVVFAESLAHLLATRGADVVAVTNDLDETLTLLARETVDICLLDVVFGAQTVVDRLGDLRVAAPSTKVVLVCGHIDQALVNAAWAAGVSGIADKRQPVAEIIEILARVHAGRLAIPARPPAAVSIPRARPKPANDAQRLATFLTPREREVLSALVSGVNTSKLARNLGIATATARCHIQSVLTKMGAHSRLEVATTAVRSGMVSPHTGEWLIHTD
ncbi:response regulator transcription factor [Dactylosporangium sp. CA-233914]|uniref:response regulator transcription factor n=1 Tax=Dactylosporangium sp. CA-233914 TaxID=3239934 RepID=UPI003D93C711